MTSKNLTCAALLAVLITALPFSAAEAHDSEVVASAAEPGLSAQYFYQSDFSGESITRVDKEVNFSWGEGEPVPDAGDEFSVRWTGQVSGTYSETYNFFTRSDDGVRVWVDGKNVIDDWNRHSVEQSVGQVRLNAEQKYDLVVEYFDGGGVATAQLSWSSASQAKQVIPSTSLFSASGSSAPTPTEIPTASPVSDASANTIQKIIDDVTLSQDDAKPHGVPTSYSWYNPVRYKNFYVPTTNYPLATSAPHKWDALTGWGQLYEAADSEGADLNRATNTRVQLSDMHTMYLSNKDNNWHTLQTSKDVEGAAYREDFTENVSQTPDRRSEPDGSISVVPGDGYNFHFWPSGGRGVMTDPDDVAAVFVTVRARLVVNDASKPSDLDQAAFVMDMGGDIWYDRDSTWDQWKTNSDMGMSRFKLVTPAWNSFSVFSVTGVSNADDAGEVMRANPPPME